LSISLTPTPKRRNKTKTNKSNYGTVPISGPTGKTGISEYECFLEKEHTYICTRGTSSWVEQQLSLLLLEGYRDGRLLGFLRRESLVAQVFERTVASCEGTHDAQGDGENT
jgi:hypothetical protein